MVVGGYWLDGMVVLFGCDKNMFGILIVFGWFNWFSMMVYGGIICFGFCGGEVFDIVLVF